MIILQKLTVKDAYRLDEEDPVIVRLDDEIGQIIFNFAQNTDLRGVFVVDEYERFFGVITRTDLLDWARVNLGAALIKPLTDMEKTIRMSTLIDASTISDMLRQETINVAVSSNDSLAIALRMMIETDLIVLPVIDESQQVIGNLTLSELLCLVLIKSRENQQRKN